MSILGAPVALFPAVSSLVGLIDPTLFNQHILREGRDMGLKEAVEALGAVVRTGKASLPMDALAKSPKKEGADEDTRMNLAEAFQKLTLPAEMRQHPSNTLSEVLNAQQQQQQQQAAASMNNDAPAAESSVNNNNGGIRPVGAATSLSDLQLTGGFSPAAATASSSSSPNNDGSSSGSRFDVLQWFRNQAQGVRNSIQQSQQQAENFWLGGFRRPFRQSNVNRDNLPENYFVRTPVAWRMLVPYGLLMNFVREFTILP